MKKLTKKLLSEILKKDYFISCFVEIIEQKEKNKFYIVYPYYMVIIWFNKEYGWNYSIFGETGYVASKRFIKLIDSLEGAYTLNMDDESK